MFPESRLLQLLASGTWQDGIRTLLCPIILYSASELPQMFHYPFTYSCSISATNWALYLVCARCIVKAAAYRIRWRFIMGLRMSPSFPATLRLRRTIIHMGLLWRLRNLLILWRGKKFQSFISWQPTAMLGEEGGRETFFYHLSSDASSFISYMLAADWALCRCCLRSVNQSGRMSSEGLVGLLIINYSPHQQTHSVTGTLKPIAMITEANSIKSQIKRWESTAV